MTQTRLYKIAANIRMTCNQLQISHARILERCRLPSDYLDNEERGVDVHGFLSVIEAFAQECADPELPLILGQGSACGPFQSALLAFSASPDIHTGLQRLAVFKPLLVPVRLTFAETEDSFTVRFGIEGGHRIPRLLAAMEIVYFLDCARTFTAHQIVPRAVELPDLSYVTPAYRDYVRGPIRQGTGVRLSFDMVDARRPLVSADTDFYKLVEAELLSRLNAGAADTPLSNRVRRALTDLLPSGAVSSDHIAAHLGFSKRTLQRRLKDEGTTFQAIMDDTRAALAITYLRDQKLSAEETSYLLAYQDPNSFYRAFHDWTGMTPAQARSAPVV
ncbi:helix-turn-helix domain-containing protein [Actibacterium ureilyticum]|uniref:helix-turn-helix domain-containing protein n=1 Tax=Actibacterium ureilyticum TaxID=1590614 RepID=UPI000BAAD1D0|nr:AraC family transcriptional regulator [Actibacterium ureilyticum]